MVKNGFSFDLQRQYRKSKWFESIGCGAMVRSRERVSLEGALYSLQQQLGLKVHFGGKTALAIQGKAHYLSMRQKMSLFGSLKESLPKWFTGYENWNDRFTFTQTNFLPNDLGLVESNCNGHLVMVSSVTRAIMECIYLAPQKQSLLECYELLEGLYNLRPQVVQQLLEKCSSVKVKRLFLYLADKANHSWFKHLQIEKIDLGSGKRSVVKHGVYNAKYQIVVPKELEEDNQRNFVASSSLLGEFRELS